MREAFSNDGLANLAPWQIRPLEIHQLGGLMSVQEACYGALYMESADIYRDRLACPGHCSLVAVKYGAVLAYLAAYRSTRGSVTPLHGNFKPCAAPDTLYVHDMAAHPRSAGRGLASALFAYLWKQAHDWSPGYSALVAVQGSQEFWSQKGYRPSQPLTAEDRAALQSYGAGAVYMARRFSPVTRS